MQTSIALVPTGLLTCPLSINPAGPSWLNFFFQPYNVCLIAIIAVLIGLLLPAVMKVREAANRMKCAHNLRQLGLALLLYENYYGKFPPGQVTGPFPEAHVTQKVHHGWGPFILPYIEQEALAYQYHWDLDMKDPGNQPVVDKLLNVFQCPSAPPDRFMRFGVFAAYGGKAACGDYAPTWSVDPALVALGYMDRPADYRGVLVQCSFRLPNRMTRMSDIKDGTSNTLMLTEGPALTEWTPLFLPWDARPDRDQDWFESPAP